MFKNLSKCFVNAGLLFGAMLIACAGTAFAQADPRMWRDIDSLRGPIGDPNGIKVRQGHHVEWQRASYRRPDGYVLVAWSDCRSGDRDVYGQLISPSGQEMWQHGGIAIVDYPYRQEDPEVVSTSDGDWIIAWIDFRYDSTGDVFAQKINNSGVKQWSDSTGMVVDTFSCNTLNCGSAVFEVTLRAVSDNAGGAIIAWEDNRRDPTLDVLAQHVNNNGVRQWLDADNHTSMKVTWRDGGQSGITADADGNGNMLVAWQDGRTGAQEIYCAKVTSGGQLPWGGEGGMIVCGASGRQSSPKLCPDGTGGCYVAWTDQRNPTDDVYAQRVNSSGVPQWTTDGIPICDTTYNQEDVRVATSINGSTPDGLIAIWEDQRVNAYRAEVYAQKVSPTGTPLWTVNGVRVCGNAGFDTTGGPTGDDRGGVRFISDLAGGLIAAWEDTRNSDNDPNNCDLYGARILANGTLSTVWGGECGLDLADGQRAQNQPLLRADAGTGFFMFYDDLRLGSQSINFHHFDVATGTRLSETDSVLIFGLDGNAAAPLTVAMSSGRVGIVWQDNREQAGGVALFYQIVDSTEHFEKLVNGDTLVPDNEGHPEVSQNNHQMCPDGGGGFFVSFEDLRTGAKRIRMTHMSSSGQLLASRAAVPVWADGNTTDQQNAFCASDGAGGCYVAWSNYDAGYHIDAYVMRVNSDCTPAWASPVRLTQTDDDDILWAVTGNPDHSCTVVWKSGDFPSYNISAAHVLYDASIAYNFTICDAPDAQDEPTVISDGHGGDYFAWSDSRNSQSHPGFDKDIYAQHLDSAGQELWGGHNGMVVVTDTLLQQKPKLTLSDDGYVYCVWESFVATSDTSSNLDLIAQKISSTGSPLWPALGKQLCDAHGDQTDAVLYSDYGDGLFAAWTDKRSPMADVYATHWTRDGNPTTGSAGWWLPDSGGAVSTYYQWQQKPSIAHDGLGGIYCAWEDQRASGKEPLINVWMNRINDRLTSVRQLPTAALPTKPELYQNYPNPFNPTTRIAFAIPNTQRVTLEVFNELGQRVTTLVDRVMVSGKYEVQFQNPRLASGMYYYRLKTPGYTNVKKMLLLK